MYDDAGAYAGVVADGDADDPPFSWHIIPLAESDADVDQFTWPSHIVMGSCMCPLTSSLAPFADLRGFQGFFMDAATREND